MIAGLLHPGEMGSAVGAALRANGHDVLWASSGRSEAGARRRRWIGEMEEIADTFAAAGQPEGFHRAAAQVYREWAAR